MNKKEISEIKKQLTPENCSITRICGCYVNGDKNILCTSKDAFLSLPEEEEFKYFDILRHSLSGSLGKNMINMEFPLEQEMKGGTQEFLLQLRDSKLEDDQLLDSFYHKIIDNYEYPENYYIVLIHAAYDVIGKASDGTEMYDASDIVYDFILCSICPVKLAKAGLSYNPDLGAISNRVRDWVVDAPAKGFLFPQFNDRASDIHGLLYYTKNPEELQPCLVQNVLGSQPPLSAKNQKETFHTIVTDTLGDDCDYEVIRNIHDTINDMIEEKKDEPEPLQLTKNDMKIVFEQSDVPNEKMEHFEEHFEEAMGNEKTLVASNIVDTRKFDIATPNVMIKVKPGRTDLIQTKEVDGRQCLVIAIEDQVEVNGVVINFAKQNL